MDPVSAHDAAVSEIAKGVALRHVDGTSDRSAPMVEEGTGLKTWDKDGLLQGIQSGVKLHHVEEVKDRSEPRIEDGVHVQTFDKAAHLTAVQSAGAHSAVVHELKACGSPKLRHVETEDKAAPQIPADTHLKTWDKNGLMSDIAAPHQLHHVEPNDRSAPVLDASVQVKRNVHGELMGEIKSSSPSALKHLSDEAMSDRSGAHVSHTAAMRVAGAPDA